MGSERVIRSCKGWRGPWARAAVAICLAVILLVGAMTEDAHAASYPFKSTTIYADGARTAKFTCNGMRGLCCDAGAYSTFSGTASLSRLKNTSNAARCAYYYGYRKGWTTGSKAHKLARLLSWCMGNGTGGDYKTSTMKSLLKTAKKQTVGQLLLNCDHFGSYAIAMGKAFARYGEHRDVDDTIRKIRALTAEDLMEVARDIFREDRLTTLIYK